MNTVTVLCIKSIVKAGKTSDNQRELNTMKTKRTQSFIAAAAAVKKDRRVNIQDLVGGHGVSYGSIFNILLDDLGLFKKSDPWVPKVFV